MSAVPANRIKWTLFIACMCLGGCSSQGGTVSGLQNGKPYENDSVRYIFHGNSADVFSKLAYAMIQGKHKPFLLTADPTTFTEDTNMLYSTDPARWKPYLGRHFMYDVTREGLHLPIEEMEVEAVSVDGVGTLCFVDENWLRSATIHQPGEWVQVLKDAPCTIAASGAAVQINWASCTPGSVCAAAGSDQESENLDIIQGGLALKKGDRVYKLTP